MASSRRRLMRGWKQFVGPEATRADTALTIGITVAGTAGATWWARRRGADWWVTAVIHLMAVDLFGGAYVNNSRACVRWYERAGQTDANHLRFAAAHIHPFAIALVDPSLGRSNRRAAWALTHYAVMLMSTLLMRRQMGYRRPLGIALTAGGLLLDQGLGRSALLPWFAATYYPKLLMGHAAGSLWPDDDLGAHVITNRAEGQPA